MARTLATRSMRSFSVISASCPSSTTNLTAKSIDVPNRLQAINWRNRGLSPQHPESCELSLIDLPEGGKTWVCDNVKWAI